MKDSTTFWLWVIVSVGGTLFFMNTGEDLEFGKTAVAVTVLSALVVGGLSYAVGGKKA